MRGLIIQSLLKGFSKPFPASLSLRGPLSRVASPSLPHVASSSSSNGAARPALTIAANGLKGCVEVRTPAWGINAVCVGSRRYMSGQKSDLKEEEGKGGGCCQQARKDAENELGNLNAEVRLLYDSGMYGDAVPVAQEGVDVAKRLYGEDHPVYASALCNLALMLKKIGRVEDACEKYRLAIKIYSDVEEQSKATPSKNRDATIFASKNTAIGNLLQCLKYLGEYEEALELSAKLIDSVGEASGTHSIEYGVTLYKIAGIMENIPGRHKEAEDLYFESLEKLMDAKENESIEAAMCMHHLAQFYLKNFFNLKNEKGIDNSRLAMSSLFDFSSEAGLNKEMGVTELYYNEIEKLCVRAQEILSFNSVPPSHPMQQAISNTLKWSEEHKQMHSELVASPNH